MKRMRILVSRALLAVLAASVFTGCGDDSTKPPAPPGPADVNAYLRDFPAWSEFSPPLPDADGPVGDTVRVEEIVDGTKYSCNTAPYSITRTPEDIVTMNPDSEILWPGSLLQGKGYAEGIGSLAELPIRQRAPLTLSIDLLTEGNTRTVESPDLASVTQAVGALIQAAQDAGHTAGSNVLFTQERMHSVSQAALKMGLSASYMGAEVESNLEVSFSAERTNVTAYFTQRMFTVSVVLPQTPGAFFSDAFTEERLQEQVEVGRIGPGNLPVFVSNVVYGRMLIFSLSSSATEAEIRSTLNVVLESGGEGGGGELSAEQRALLEEAQIKVVTVGGDATHALALIRSGDLGEFFAEDASLTSARPITYTVRNLADNSIARVSETTQYSLRECAPEDVEPTGAEYDVRLTRIGHGDHGPIWCGGQCMTVSGYTFWIEDSQGPVQGAVFDAPGLGPPFCVNDIWELETNGGPTSAVRVRLHFDRRDVVKITGTVENVGIVVVTFDINHRGEIPLGNRTVTRWDDGTGECIRFDLTYNVIKVGDLFD